MMIDTVRIAFKMDDGSIKLTSFVTKGRGNILPLGAVWLDKDNGVWSREPTEMNINDVSANTFIDRTDDEGSLVIVPKPVSFRIVTNEEIPKSGSRFDKTFRAAWADGGQLITVDMDKARDITLDAIRKERMKVLPGLDIAWSVAMAKGDLAGAKLAENKRQALRDIPATLAPAIKAATTPEELKALTAIT